MGAATYGGSGTPRLDSESSIFSLRSIHDAYFLRVSFAISPRKNPASLTFDSSNIDERLSATEVGWALMPSGFSAAASAGTHHPLSRPSSFSRHREKRPRSPLLRLRMSAVNRPRVLCPPGRAPSGADRDTSKP